MESHPMNEFGEPNMGNPSVRFDEGRERVGHWPLAFQVQPLPPTLQNRGRNGIFLYLNCAAPSHLSVRVVRYSPGRLRRGRKPLFTLLSPVQTHGHDQGERVSCVTTTSPFR